MTRRIIGWLGFAFLLASMPAAAADQHYILKANTGTAGAIAARHNMTIVCPLDASHPDTLLVSSPTSNPANQLESELAVDGDVTSFEPDQTLVVPEQPQGLSLNQSTAAILESLTDTTLTNYFGSTVWNGYISQPAAQIIRVADAQSSYAPGAGTVAITVAVIDTGVDPNHPVLQPVLVPGYDFVHGIAGTASEWADLDQSTAAILEQYQTTIIGQGTPAVLNQSTAAILEQSTAAILEGVPLPSDFGHGTMVAGLVHLVAPTAHIMPLKSFTADGTGSLFNVVQAIYYAINNGASVINMSFSVPSSSNLLREAIAAANDAHIICVASAGNSGQQVVVYPAAYTHVIGVASTSNVDQQSAFSNYGRPMVDFAAPGEGVITTYPGGYYAAGWGTSFSAPLVSGGAALLLGVSMNSAPSVVAEPLSQPKFIFKSLSHAKFISNGLGYGRIDLFQALSEAIEDASDTNYVEEIKD